MKSVFKRHRVRATFYHVIAGLYLLLSFYVLFAIGGDWAFWMGFVLFVVDYLAEMYDPHPEAPGPWFKRHFHRFIDDDDE